MRFVSSLFFTLVISNNIFAEGFSDFGKSRVLEIREGTLKTLNNGQVICDLLNDSYKAYFDTNNGTWQPVDCIKCTHKGPIGIWSYWKETNQFYLGFNYYHRTQYLGNIAKGHLFLVDSHEKYLCMDINLK